MPLYFCPYLCQVLIDFQNSFTGTLCRQFAIMWLLHIPPHHKCIFTPPCKIPPAVKGINRVQHITALGVTLSHNFSMTKYIDTVMAGCACTLYGLRTLWAHGMPQACLQLVFRSTALAKLLYACSAWWGFANASEKNRLEAFLRWAGKSGYYTDDSLPTVADEQLFRFIRYKPTHPLRPLLPPERSPPYCTRLQLQNYELPSKINSIDECNFIYRVLYKDCF